MNWIVTGMHRSGTSLVAGLLHNTGIHFGDKATFDPKPDPANPRGYFENIEFRTLNDAILFPYVVKKWGRDITPKLRIPERHNIKMQELVRRYDSQYEQWGAKDPRFCLTLPYWKFNPEKTVLIICYRNPLEVARSLKKRDGLSIEQGLELWGIYNTRILIAEDYFPYIMKVDYSAVLEGNVFPDTVGLIDHSLHRNRETGIPESCTNIWNRLTNQMSSVRIEEIQKGWVE